MHSIQFDRCSGLIALWVVIVANLTVPASAKFVFDQIAITGDLAPGSYGAEFGAFGAPALNNSGDVAFRNELRIGTGGIPVSLFNQDAIFGPISGAGSALGLLAREDALAPGVDDGAEFNDFSDPALNAWGDVAFEVGLRAGPGGRPVRFGGMDSNNEAIFGPIDGAGSSLGLIIRQDDRAPNIIGSIEIAGLLPPALNDLGKVAFKAYLRNGPPVPFGTPVTLYNDQVIFAPFPDVNAYRVIAQEGTRAPWVTDGADYSLLIVGGSALNDSSEMAFQAYLRTGPSGTPVAIEDQEAIYGPTPRTGSSRGLIARAGSVAPGVSDGAEFSTFDPPALNALGDVAFGSVLRTGPSGTLVTPDNEVAIFGPIAGVGSDLGPIAREDDPAPGVEDGAVFDGFGLAALNDSGDVAFLAGLRTGAGGSVVTDANNEALFAFLGGGLMPILRSGDLFDVTVNGLIEQRTIEDFIFDDRGLNDAGGLAFGLRFTDGTQGIFTTTIVPEPPSVVMLFAAVMLWWQRVAGVAAERSPQRIRSRVKRFNLGAPLLASTPAS